MAQIKRWRISTCNIGDNFDTIFGGDERIETMLPHRDIFKEYAGTKIDGADGLSGGKDKTRFWIKKRMLNISNSTFLSSK